MEKKILLFIMITFFYNSFVFAQTKTNSFQIGIFRAWSENWGASNRTFELKYQKEFTKHIGFYSSLSNYFKSLRENNSISIIYKGDTTILQPSLSISRSDTEKYPYLTEEDYNKLAKTGILPLSPKELRIQIYIFELGGLYKSKVLFNHHQFGFQFGLNLTYTSIKYSGNRETIRLLIEELNSEKKEKILYEYPLYFRNLDLSVGLGLNYKYLINDRLYLGLDLNLHNGFFLTSWNDSLIPGYLGLGLVIGTKF